MVGRGRWATVFAGFGVVSVEERVVGACGFELGDPVPEGILLVEMANVRHFDYDDKV